MDIRVDVLEGNDLPVYDKDPSKEVWVSQGDTYAGEEKKPLAVAVQKGHRVIVPMEEASPAFLSSLSEVSSHLEEKGFKRGVICVQEDKMGFAFFE